MAANRFLMGRSLGRHVRAWVGERAVLARKAGPLLRLSRSVLRKLEWSWPLGVMALLLPSAARADDATDLEGLLSENVVSGASKSSELASDAPATTSVLTAADMRRYGIRSLAEAIDFLGMGVIT